MSSPHLSNSPVLSNSPHSSNSSQLSNHSLDTNEKTLQQAIAGKSLTLQPLSLSQLQEIELIYNASKTANKLLKIAHLEAVLHLIGLCPTQDEIEQYFKMVGNNNISQSELIEIVAFALQKRWNKDQILQQAMRCFYLLSDQSFHAPISRLRALLCGTISKNNKMDDWMQRHSELITNNKLIPNTFKLSERDFDILLYEKQLSLHHKIGLDDFLRILSIDTTTSPPLLGI